MDIILMIIIILLIIALTTVIIKRNRKQFIELSQLRADHTTQRIDLGKAEERIVYLSEERDKLISELQQERRELAEMNRLYESNHAYYKIQQEKITEQKSEIEKLQEKFSKDFELVAARILDEKTKKFTEVNRSNMDILLSPLKENIKAFEEKVEKVYKSESDERNVLKGEITKLVELNKQISEEAHNLTKALKSDSKKQGNWGEIVLDRILEASGLVKGESYTKQISYSNDQGERLQPDVVVALPDNKHIVIDSKVSLIAYERFISSESEEDRITFTKDHINSIKAHIKNLCGKNYCDLYGINTPDFVLLFVPVESSFSLAVQHDTDLFEFAWSRRVVIVTPSTLLATLKTIASIWKQEQQTRNAIEIAVKAGALYDKFVGFITDLKKIGDSLDKAKDAYSEAFGKLSSGNGNLIVRVENLKKLGAKTSKAIDDQLLTDKLN